MARGIRGKYLTVSMASWLDAIESNAERFGDLDERYDLTVRAELKSLSTATIDRYLALVKARAPVRGPVDH